MAKRSYVTNPILPKGRYRIIPTSLHLVVEDTAAYLTFQVSGHTGASSPTFSLEVPGIVQITQEFITYARARELVVAYLNAAYVERDTTVEWMAFVEERAHDDIKIWMYEYWDSALGDIDRDVVSGGYEAWIDQS